MDPLYLKIKLTIGVLATIGLYTVLYRENKFYRFVEHVFLGLASGWALVVLWTETLKEKWWDRMVGTSPLEGDVATPGYWAFVLLLPIGLMGYFVFSRKHNWLSRIPIGIILGLWSGQQIQVWFNRYGPQMRDSMKPILPTATDSFFTPNTSAITDPAQLAQINANVYPSEALTNIMYVFTLLAVLSYFLFSFEIKGKFMRGMTTSGRWLLMIGFGAIFGSTVMMRFTLLIDRMYFVWIEWLKQQMLGMP
jgi:hypothetical protein